MTTAQRADYDMLDPAARRLFELLGAQPLTRFCLPMLTAVTPSPHDLPVPCVGVGGTDDGKHLRGVLDELVATGLLAHQPSVPTTGTADPADVDGPWWTIDEAAHEFARRLVDPAAGRAALVRVTDQALWPRLHAADLIVTPYRRRTAYPGTAHTHTADGGQEVFADRVEAMTWLERHLDTIAAYAHALYEVGKHERVWHVIDALWPLWLHRKHYHTRLELDALALRAATAVGDESGQAAMYTRIGLTHTSLAQYDAAALALKAGLTARLRLGDSWGQADCRSALGGLHRVIGDLHTADKQLSLAADIYQQVGAHRETALTRHHRGVIQLDRGNLEWALALLTEAVEDFLTLADPDPYNHARALTDLGRATTELDDYDAAAEALADAETCLRELDNHAELARVLIARADLVDARGEPGGWELRESALRSLERVGSPRAEALRSALYPEPTGDGFAERSAVPSGESS